VPVLGACPHYGCPHNSQTVLGWGPDQTRYQLIRCDVQGGCEGACRAMLTAGGSADRWRFTERETIRG